MSLVPYETYELSKTSEDVFIEMAKYLYDTYGFAKLNEYYIFLKEKKREIVIIFCNLTEFISAMTTKQRLKNVSVIF